MASINPISGPTPQIQPLPAAKPLGSDNTTDKASFSKLLETYVGKVNADQTAASSAAQDLLTGKSEDILPVVQAMAKADLSFKLLMGVRNKVIEAYKQTMNMQV